MPRRHLGRFEALDTGAILSVARGLARSENSYKAHLAACDLPRRNDLDGRGTLSEEAVAAFTRFLLETCLDQVRFMEELVQPNRLRDRILLWVEEGVRAGSLPAKAGQVLEAVLFRGELPRGDVSALLGTSDRQARRVVSALAAPDEGAGRMDDRRLVESRPASFAGHRCLCVNSADAPPPACNGRIGNMFPLTDCIL